MHLSVERLANALLYEGYVLYPYRPSSLKNRERWTFGGLFPRAWSEANGGAGEGWSLQTEFLVQGEQPKLELALRFLHLFDAKGWQQARERRAVIAHAGIDELPHELELAFAADVEESVGRQTLVRAHARARVERVADQVHRVSLKIENAGALAATETRSEAALHALISAHLVLGVDHGHFISLLEPAEHLRDAASQCKNVGVWPVLVGEAGQRNVMLVSPVILYDYPRLAPESQGDLFDATEIDEILSLRILTLTDAEKAEVRASDPRAAALLERTERLGAEELMRLHGARRKEAL